MSSSESASTRAPIVVGPGQRVFVLTGAGISQESGIATYRDLGGLWERYRFEEVASPEGWQRDPELVWRFYSERRVQARACEPNAAHRAIAEWEAKLGERLMLCTQNVDDLHERAGSRRVLHMHGELFASRCEDPLCPSPLLRHDGELPAGDTLLRCVCGARLRPHICWFGEVPFGLDAIEEALSQADLFITIGSSGAVYPAAGFVAHARALGRARTVYTGLERPDNAALFDECRLGKATSVVPDLLAIG